MPVFFDFILSEHRRQFRDLVTYRTRPDNFRISNFWGKGQSHSPSIVIARIPFGSPQNHGCHLTDAARRICKKVRTHHLMCPDFFIAYQRMNCKLASTRPPMPSTVQLLENCQ